MAVPTYTSFSNVILSSVTSVTLASVTVSASDKYLIVFAVRDDATTGNPHAGATWGVNAMTDFIEIPANQISVGRGRQAKVYVLDVEGLAGTETVTVTQPSRPNNVVMAVATNGYPLFGSISSANVARSYSNTSLLSGFADFSVLNFVGYDNNVALTDNYSQTELESGVASNMTAKAAHLDAVDNQTESGWQGSAGNWTQMTLAISTVNYLSSSSGGGGGWPIGLRI